MNTSPEEQEDMAAERLLTIVLIAAPMLAVCTVLQSPILCLMARVMFRLAQN